MSLRETLLTGLGLLFIACAPAAVEPKTPDRCSEPASARAEPDRASSLPLAAPVSAPAAAPKAPAPLRVDGTWHFTCCNGAYAGGLVLTQEGRIVRGIFLGDRGMGTYVDGEVDGTKLTFTRRWLNAGRPFSQIYSVELENSGARMAGTFIETHAPTPPQPFDAERRWQPDLHDFGETSRAEPAQQKTTAVTKAQDNPLQPRCDCKNACFCSGIPDRMRCHSECHCPKCPPNIP